MTLDGTQTNSMAAGLPLPRLSRGHFQFAHGKRLSAWSDDRLFEQTGVRIAFTSRDGGVSEGAYASLDLGSNVPDDLSNVERNRARLCAAMGADSRLCVTPLQIHGIHLVDIVSSDDDVVRVVASAQKEAGEGADGIVVARAGVSALLCYADCMPIVLVSPKGDFAVLHSGWRGTIRHICIEGVRHLMRGSECSADQLNAYIGPYIHHECFEVSEELAQRFSNEFGTSAVPEYRHVDLGVCVRADLTSIGMDATRIADVDRCTACHPDDLFSYRATRGQCGRHGAFAVRTADALMKGNDGHGNI